MPPATRDIPFEELKKYFHVPMKKATKELNICTTVLKRICRGHGLNRWPYRKVRSIEQKIERLQQMTPKTLQEQMDQTNEIVKLRRKRISLLSKPSIHDTEQFMQQQMTWDLKVKPTETYRPVPHPQQVSQQLLISPTPTLLTENTYSAFKNVASSNISSNHTSSSPSNLSKKKSISSPIVTTTTSPLHVPMTISPPYNNYYSSSGSSSDEEEAAVQRLSPMITSKSNSIMFPKLSPLEPILDPYWNQYTIIQNTPASPPITTATTKTTPHVAHWELPDWFKQDLETIKNSAESELISHRHHHSSNINILINV